MHHKCSRAIEATVNWVGLRNADDTTRGKGMSP